MLANPIMSFFSVMEMIDRDFLLILNSSVESTRSDCKRQYAQIN